MTPSGPLDDLTHRHLYEAIGELKETLKVIAAMVRSFEGRMVRVETILAIVGSVTIIATAMASCGITSRFISLPQVAGPARTAP